MHHTLNGIMAAMMECTKCKAGWIWAKAKNKGPSYRCSETKYNSSISTCRTKRSRFWHACKVYHHWTTPKRKAKQRKHHRNTQKAWELLNKNTRNSTSEKTSESTNIILFIFSVQLAFTRKCISISKIREIEYNQRRIWNFCSVWDGVICDNSLQLQAVNYFIENSVLDAVGGPASAYNNVRFINEVK